LIRNYSRSATNKPRKAKDGHQGRRCFITYIYSNQKFSPSHSANDKPQANPAARAGQQQGQPTTQGPTITGTPGPQLNKRML